MSGMSNVLNEFLAVISRGFEDAAFASFSRRRTTVRDDIDQTFVTIPEKGVDEEDDDSMLASAMAAPPPPPKGDSGDLEEL